MAGTANAVNGPEAAPYVAKAGATMTGALILNTSSPSTDLQAASKGYVDETAQGRQFKDPCAAATTGALTVTYNNGSSGVGATLTNAGAMAAFAVDGYSAVVGDRILIKDQASTLQNGIYTVTTVGSGAANWVLTRATDMDTPSQFLYATTVILNGTTNQGRTYTETATVAAVGVDAVTFVLTGDATGVTSVTFTGDGTVLSNTPSSPVTSTGTLTAALNTQTANRVFVGPSSGGAAAPTFRALVAADMGSQVQTYAPVITLVGGAGNTVPQYTTLTGTYVTSGNLTTVWVNAAGDGGAEGAGTGRMNVTLPVACGSTAIQATPIGYMFNNATEAIIFGQISASGTTVQLQKMATFALTNFTGDDQNNANRQFNFMLTYFNA